MATGYIGFSTGMSNGVQEHSREDYQYYLYPTSMKLRGDLTNLNTSLWPPLSIITIHEHRRHISNILVP